MTLNQMQTVVGIDPSLTCTGVAVVTAESHPWTSSVVKVTSTGKKDDDWYRRSQRLDYLKFSVVEYVPFKSLVVMESPSYGAIGGSAHDRSGLWWMIFNWLRFERECLVLPVSSAQRQKYATGKGNADKDTVLAAAIKRYPDIDITNNNTADAVIFAAIGCRLLGEPLEESLPTTHLDAMKKIKLPDLAEI
jgi:crossover junction endodeoxyribonuclease RuvC